jgi:heat shock protein HtpX
MKRIFLFLLTNIAVLIVISIVVHVLGFDHFLHANGLNYPQLLGFSAVIGFVGSFFSLAISKWMAKSIYGIVPIASPANEEEEWLVDTIRRQAAKARIAMPEVGIYESPEVNAFATGPSRANSLVAVSSGLLSTMTRTEAEGVLAHEITHVSNGDMVTMTLLQGVLNTFVIFFSYVLAFFVDRLLQGNREDDRGPGLGFFLGRLACQVLLGFLASLVVMAYSRHREFRADAGSAALEGKGPMLAALRRLKQITEGDPIVDDRSPALSAFKINGKPGATSIFADHPSLDDRIAALEKLP